MEDLPDQMNLNGTPIINEDLAEQFASMFEKKIEELASATSIDDNVYNGTKKINEQLKLEKRVNIVWTCQLKVFFWGF